MFDSVISTLEWANKRKYSKNSNPEFQKPFPNPFDVADRQL